MTHLDILSARIERGYRLAKDPDRRPILTSALDLVEAAAACGQGVTLNPVQTAALHAWLDYHAAAQELGLRETAPRETRAASASTAPGNVIPFARA